MVVEDVALQIRWSRDRLIVPHDRAGDRRCRAGCRRGPGRLAQADLVGVHARRDGLARIGVHQLVGEVEAVHGVVRVAYELAVGGGDLGSREARRQRRAADQHRAADAGGPQVLGRHHHLLRGLDQQPREPDQVRAVLAMGLDQVLGRHLDAQVDDAEAVVAEDDLDQVLPDVVHVALDGGEHDRPLVGALALLHEGLEVRDRRLHRLGRLQHLGHDQLVVVEEAAHLVHAGHERAVDDLEGLRLLQLQVEVVDQAVFRSLDDVARQALIQ